MAFLAKFARRKVNIFLQLRVSNTTGYSSVVSTGLFFEIAHLHPAKMGCVISRELDYEGQSTGFALDDCIYEGLRREQVNHDTF